MTKSADAFRTISEVADWLGIPAHVLRFWESKFSQVKPVKRAGGRRYYRPADMQLLGGIRKLLHDDGMTIKGVQKIMRDQGVRHVAAMSPPLDADLEAAVAGIALDVPEAEEEPRGQIVSFDRTGGGKPKPSASPPQPAAETPAERMEPPADRMEPQEDPQPSADEDTVEVPDDAPAEELPADDAAHPEAAGAIATTELAGRAADPDEAEAAGESAAPPQATGPDADAAPPADTPERQPNLAAEAEAPVADSAPGGADAASPLVAAIETPEDPPDTIAAPSSVLSILAGIDPPSPRNAAQYAEARARLTDLRQRIAGSGTSS